MPNDPCIIEGRFSCGVHEFLGGIIYFFILLRTLHYNTLHFRKSNLYTWKTCHRMYTSESIIPSPNVQCVWFENCESYSDDNLLK